MAHLCGMSGAPRKAYMEQNNMHDSFSPLRKKCSKNVWGETDLSGPQGRREHLPQSSPGCQEEEKKDETGSHHFLNEAAQPQPCPDTLSRVPEKRVSSDKTTRVVSRETVTVPGACWAES